MKTGLRVARLVPALTLVVVLTLSARAGDENFLPISPQELSLTSVPQAPGAAAVILYREEHGDDNRHLRYEYVRRKILTKEGLKYADVEIPYFRPYSGISNLKARTIHPDGTIIDFKGEVFDKTIIKSRDIKIKAKTFTLPDVTVGSIVEYRFYYTLEQIGPQRELIYNSRWDMQDELFTVRAKFWLLGYKGDLNVFSGGSTRLYYVYSHFPPGVQPPRINPDGTTEIEMNNLPALEEEEYMPPRDILGTQVRFYYGGDAMRSTDEFWKAAGKYWNKQSEDFIGQRSAIQDAAKSIVAAGDPPETKARKLYATVQSLRNRSFERWRTPEEEKAANLKDAANIEDVWKNKYGFRRDLNRLYVGLARAAGLNAAVVRTSERRDTIFNKNVMSLAEMPYEIVVLNLDGKDVYLDPGMKYCPFGELPWYATSTAALKLDKDGGAFVKTPAPVLSTIKRTGNLILDPDGTLHGELVVQFNDLTGIAIRDQEWGEDETGRAKDLEDQVKSWLPAESTVKMIKSENWEGSEPAMAVRFTIQVPNFASVTGKRTLMPRGIFQGKDEYLFQHAERKFPVYMHYPYEHYDVVDIKVPAGAVLESLPPRKTETNDFVVLDTIAQFQVDTLHLERRVSILRFYYPLEQYEQLRAFFGRVKNADEEQIVLTKKTP